jgi:hypothetical protein
MTSLKTWYSVALYSIHREINNTRERARGGIFPGFVMFDCESGGSGSSNFFNALAHPPGFHHPFKLYWLQNSMFSTMINYNVIMSAMKDKLFSIILLLEFRL